MNPIAKWSDESLLQTSLFSVTDWALVGYYYSVNKAEYGRASEYWTQLRIDFILVEARNSVRSFLDRELAAELHAPADGAQDPVSGAQHSADGSQNSASRAQHLAREPQHTSTLMPRLSRIPKHQPQKLVVNRNLELLVEIVDNRPGIDNYPKKMRVFGKADWVITYGTHGDSTTENILVIVQAKPEAFSLARYQLLTYLAIMQHIRKQKGSTMIHVQGFYSDGRQFVFMGIDETNKVFESAVFDCRDKEHLVRIYMWIVYRMLAAIVSLTTRQKEASPFNNQVVVKVCNSADAEDYGLSDDEDPGEA